MACHRASSNLASQGVSGCLEAHLQSAWTPPGTAAGAPAPPWLCERAGTTGRAPAGTAQSALPHSAPPRHISSVQPMTCSCAQGQLSERPVMLASRAKNRFAFGRCHDPLSQAAVQGRPRAQHVLCLAGTRRETCPSYLPLLQHCGCKMQHPCGSRTNKDLLSTSCLDTLTMTYA